MLEKGALKVSTDRGYADPFGWLGQVIDAKYRVEAVIGTGGFGIVYRAHHATLDGPVAIKCLDLRVNLEADHQRIFFEAFKEEGRILHQLAGDTNHIVRALDLSAAVSPRGFWTPYLVLEWLDGVPLQVHLAQRIARGEVLGIDGAINLLAPAAAALEAAHKRGIAHRDVKPANLFLVHGSDKPTLKVLDFGIAKVMTDRNLIGAAYENTGWTIRAFTAGYGAPEQFDPGTGGYGATGPWTDVYALALIFIETVSGTRAYAGVDVTHYHLQAVDRDRRPSLASKGIGQASAIDAVLARALAVDPRNRFKTAGKFWEALTAAVGSTAIARSLSGDTEPSNPPVSPVGPVPTEHMPTATTTGAQVPGTAAAKSHVSSQHQSARARWPERLAITIAMLLLAAAGFFGWRELNTGSTSATPSPTKTASTVGVPPRAKPADLEVTSMITVPGAKSVVFGAGVYGVDCNPLNTNDECPLTQKDRERDVRTFKLDRTEVTVGQYKHCVDEGPCSRPGIVGTSEDLGIGDDELRAEDCNYSAGGRADHPVNCVSQRQAHTYCNWVGKRLPTADEREFAARANPLHAYPWGSDHPTCSTRAVWGRAHKTGKSGVINVCSLKGFREGTEPVGSFKDGAIGGLMDMAGNVAEWTEPTILWPANDPTHPARETRYAIYGGSWMVRYDFIFAYRRLVWPGHFATPVTGFRCAKDDAPVSDEGSKPPPVKKPPTKIKDDF